MAIDAERQFHPPEERADQSRSCLERVQEAQPRIRGARGKVGEYVLSAPWEARESSITELAQRSGTSENAVSRFVRTLGYASYRQFSQALSLDLGRSVALSYAFPLDGLPQEGRQPEPSEQMVTRVFRFEVACLEDTLANLDPEKVRQAVAALSEARQILLVGTSSAAPLCQMAQYRLSNAGLDAAWSADPMVMVSEASRLGPADVVLGISYNGRSRPAVETLAYARNERSAKTICVTAAHGAPILEQADIGFVVFGTAVPPAGARFSGRVAGLVLLEALITAVAAQKYIEMRPRLAEMNRAQRHINELDEREDTK